MSTDQRKSLNAIEFLRARWHDRRAGIPSVGSVFASLLPRRTDPGSGRGLFRVNEATKWRANLTRNYNRKLRKR